MRQGWVPSARGPQFAPHRNSYRRLWFSTAGTPLSTINKNTATLAASSARVTGFRRAVKASVDSGWAAGGATSAEALGYVTVALRQSGHTPLASPHESRANSRPQFLQFAN